MSRARQRRIAAAISLFAVIVLALTWTASTRSDEIPEGITEKEPVRSTVPLALLGKVNDARSVDAVAYAPDGKLLVSAHRDRTLCIWDTATNKLMRKFRGPERPVTQLVFRADGKEFLTASGDDCAAVWDVAEGRKVQAFQAAGLRLLNVAYDPAGEPIAWLTDASRRIAQHHVASGVEQRSYVGHQAKVHAVALSPDGLTLASCSDDKTVRLWETASGKELKKLRPNPEFQGRRMAALFEEPITSLRYAPNGWTLIGGTHDLEMFIWDADSADMVGMSNGSAADMFRAMAFSPDGKRLLYAVDGSRANGDEQRPAGWQEGVAFGTFEVTGAVIYRDQEKVTCLACSPDGRRLAAGVADGTVTIWDAGRWPSSRASHYGNYGDSGNPGGRDGLFDHLWSELGNPMSRRHFETRWMFVDTGAAGVEYLQKKIRPVQALPAEQVRKLIAELDSDEPAVRARAQQQLADLGTSIEEELRKTLLAAPAPEVKLRVNMLLETFDATRIRRGIQILEQMHAPQARALLQELAKGAPAAWQTQQAQAALKRLARRVKAAPPRLPQVQLADVKVAVPTKPLQYLEKVQPGPAQKPGFDALGDPLPAGARARMGSARMRHRGPASDIAFAPDGKSLISIGDKVRFWDLESGKETRSHALSAPDENLAVSADGKMYFTWGGTMRLYCWDLASGRHLGTFAPDVNLDGANTYRKQVVVRQGPGGQQFTEIVAVSADGGTVGYRVAPDLKFVLYDGTVWEPATGKAWRHQPKVQDRNARFGADGKTAIFATARGLILYDLLQGKEIRRLAGPKLKLVGCSRDDKLLVVGDPEKIQVLDMASGKKLREFADVDAARQVILPADDADDDEDEARMMRHTGRTSYYSGRGVVPPVLSADAGMLARYVGEGIDLLDLVTGTRKKLTTSMTRNDGVTSIAFSPDGKLLAAALTDGRLLVWNLATGQPRFAFPQYSAGFGESYVNPNHLLSPDGKILAGFEPDGRIGFWDAATGILVARLGHPERPMNEVMWSHSGTKLVTSSASYSETCLWNVADGRLLWHSNYRGEYFVGFSSDDRLFAAGSREAIRVFETATGKELRRFRTNGQLATASLSPDGKQLVACGTDAQLHVWNIDTGASAVPDVPQGFVGIVNHSPDGKLLACLGSDGHITLRETSQFRLARTLDAQVDPNGLVDWSADGKLLLAEDARGGCIILDSESGAPVQRIPAGGSETVYARILPDNKGIIVANMNGTALVWDLAGLAAAQKNPAAKTPVQRSDPPHEHVLNRLGEAGLRAGVWLSPDGRMMLSQEGESIRFLDVATGKEIRRLNHLQAGNIQGTRYRYSARYGGYYSNVEIDDVILSGGMDPYVASAPNMVNQQADRIELSPDGKFLAGCSSANNAVIIWDAVTGRRLRQFKGLEQQQQITALAISPDSRFVAVTSSPSGYDRYGQPVRGMSNVSSTVQIWDVAAGRLKQVLVGPQNFAYQLAFSTDGTYLTAMGIRGQNNQNNLDLATWNLISGKLIRHTRIPSQWSLIAPNGRTLAYSTGDNLFLWDVLDDKFLPRPQLKRGLSVCVFSGDSKLMATYGDDEPIRWWDVATAKELGSLGERGAALVGFSHDKKILVATKGTATRFWDLTTKQEIRGVAGHREPVTALVFAADKRSVFSGGGDATIRQWDVKTGKELRCLTAHKQAITHLTLSADGRRLASVDQENAVIVWNAHTGEMERHLTRKNFNPGASKQYGPPSAIPGLPVPPPVPGARPPVFMPNGGFVPPPPAPYPGGMPDFPDASAVAGLVFTEDGKTLLALHGSGAIARWDLQTGKNSTAVKALKEMDGNNRVAFALSPNGRYLAHTEITQIQISEDFATLVGSIRIREVSTGKLVRTIIGSEDQFLQLAFSRDGKLLTARTAPVRRWSRHDGGNDNKTRVWEVESGDEIRASNLATNNLGFSPRGELIDTTTGALRLWDLATAQERWIPTGLGPGFVPSTISFSSDGKLIALGCDRRIVIMDGESDVFVKAHWPAPPVPRTLPALWQDLAGEASLAWDALEFLRKQPAVVAYLSERLRPAPTLEPEQLAKLLADLGDDASSVRQSAERRLEALEENAEQALRLELKNPKLSLDVRSRIDRLLSRLESGPSAEQLRSLRALTILERIGTAQAAALLRTLASGAPTSRITRESRASLERIAARAP